MPRPLPKCLGRRKVTNDVQVEFFGIPRRRTGIASIAVPCDTSSVTLAEIFGWLEARFPDLQQDCIRENVLLPSCIVNLNAQEFVQDSSKQVTCSDTVILMSADAGG